MLFRHFISQIFLVMRITIVQVCFFIFFSFNGFGNKALSQDILNKEISINVNEVSFKKVLSDIEKSTNVRFVYSSNSELLTS